MLLSSLVEFVTGQYQILAFQGFMHVSLVVQCVSWATIGAVGVAALVYQRQRAVGVAMGFSAIGLTIPSFALLGFLIAPLGCGVLPAVVAVAFYASVPILRNAIVGLAGVDRTLVDAARGMGMSRVRTLLTVELPIAWQVVLTGIRVSTQMVMGVAAVAAYVSGPGLGGLIFTGLSRLGGANALEAAVVGTVGIVLLALVLDLLLVLLGRLTTPRGIRV